MAALPALCSADLTLHSNAPILHSGGGRPGSGRWPLVAGILLWTRSAASVALKKSTTEPLRQWGEITVHSLYEIPL